MKKTILNTSISEYWEISYQSGEMGWDLGGITPVFDDWIKTYNKELSICVVGAGNGWDAINFATKGHNVTAVDFAESEIQNMRKLAELNKVEIHTLHMDIFDLKKQYKDHFDIVLEYTCYCAINPKRRSDYINTAYSILKSSGKLVAIFFSIDKILNENGPPYGVNINATIISFSKLFTLESKEISSLSIDSRKNKEIFVIFRKNGL